MASKAKKLIKWIAIVITAIVIGFVMWIGVLTITEYKPDEVVELDINKSNDNIYKKSVPVDSQMSMVTWNIGYCSLGENADFFMDGGKSVYSSTKEQTQDNLEAVIDELKNIDADFICLQEVDDNSTRSNHVNQKKTLEEEFSNYQSTFAYNYKVLFIPYPIPPLGQVKCGLSSYSKYEINDSKRQALPCPFKYPLRTCNLKRCLIINRHSVENSDKELVVINLHLEAYDSGEGKIAQTKQLKEFIDSECAKGNYVIAAGDFNQTFSNIDGLADIKDENLWKPSEIDVDDFENVTFVTDETVPTCRSLDRPYTRENKKDFSYYYIDGFIVSNNITVNEVKNQNLDFKNSDHNPIVLKFELNGEK